MDNKAEKLKAFQAFLKQSKTGAFAVTDLPSINLISGFKFSGQGDSFLLITPSKAFCFTKPLYIIDLKKKAPYLTLIDSLNPQDIVALIKKLKIQNAAFDPCSVMYIPGNIFKDNGFTEKAGFLNNIKEVKTATEIKHIKKACAISAKAFSELQKYIKTGITEKQLAKKLEDIMAALGGEGLAFETIMAFGENSANPHHITGDRKLKNNEVVLMDYGCKRGGYCSDITRTMWHGPKPSKEFTETFKAVKTAHDLAIKQAKAAMGGAAVDKICRDYFDGNEVGEFFIHGTGHSLGLEIHEKPFLGKTSLDILQNNNVFTVEPGLYFEGKFGVRYEDTVHLTPKGAKILTK